MPIKEHYRKYIRCKENKIVNIHISTMYFKKKNINFKIFFLLLEVPIILIYFLIT